MQLKNFYYNLPEHLVAQSPLVNREEAKLMVVDRKAGKIRHDRFSNVGHYLPKGSVLVLNNSKVVPARLFGIKERSGGGVEIFLLKKLSDGCSYEVLLRPLKKIRNGDKIRFLGSPLVAHIVDTEKRIVTFNRKDISQCLGRIGHMPLPPYIKRKDTPLDREFYQTVYARHEGSVAAPTAGLHFTKPLLSRLKRAGHGIEQVTLHINYATFKPVEEKDITKHTMHFETYSLSPLVEQRIRKVRQAGKKVVAVGTTSCRVLEATAQSGKLKGSTNLFIYPGFEFKRVDALITNFHLPHSSLLMLVYAFGSVSLMKKAYKEAVRNEYRFYSYGDAMLII